jgi:hypothetical protein
MLLKIENGRSPHPKKWAQSAHQKSPSFVYRQDGYELSYEVEVIITPKKEKVKGKVLTVPPMPAAIFPAHAFQSGIRNCG